MSTHPVLLKSAQGLLIAGALCLCAWPPLAAQVQTTVTETRGEPVKEVTIERSEVAYVNGGTIIVRNDQGTLREMDNEPPNATFLVDGNPVPVKDLKVGMMLEKQTVKTTTPKIITKVETVTGTVWHVSPPASVMLRLENGQIQKFAVPTDQKFVIDGRETDVWDLRKGMKVTAQKMTETPETVVEQEISRTGTAPPPPPAPKADIPVLVVVTMRIPSPTAPVAEAQAATLPQTASSLPLFGIAGGMLCLFALASRAFRGWRETKSS